MAQVAMKPMTPEEFNVWEQTQLERHELVDGVPVLKFVQWDGAKMMVGATGGHGDIVANVAAALHNKLRGKNCRVYPSDGKVSIPGGNWRYPDVTVNCGPRDREATAMSNPVAVIEVLSKSTFWIDKTRKLRDYQSVPSVQSILLLAQDEIRGQLWLRGTAEWGMEELEGPDAAIWLPVAEAGFSLGEAYEGVF